MMPRSWNLTLIALLTAAFSSGCRPAKNPATTLASAVPKPQKQVAAAGDSVISGSIPAGQQPEAAENWRSASTPKLNQWRSLDGLPVEWAQFETVFWDASDTNSLRAWLADGGCRQKNVLEIGTGTGLLAMWCLQHGATHVVATDINPNALANAAYNADRLQIDVDDQGPPQKGHLQLRWVQQGQPGAFAVIDDSERFDLIISNPPWEDQQPEKLLDFAFYDKKFSLLESLLTDVANHLEPEGRCLLAYGCVTAIRTVLKRSEHHQLHATILDDRDLDSLPELFAPGMLIEVRPE